MNALQTLAAGPLLLAASALAAGSAAAATTFSTFRADLPVDFVPAKMAQPDATGLWITGQAGTYGPLVLARYRNDGSVAQVRLGQPGLGVSQVAALPDGGFVLLGVSPAPQDCTISRYDATGMLRWSSTSVSRGSGPACSAFAIDGAGGIWIDSDKLYRLGADGAVETRVAHDSTTVNQLVGDPSGTGVFLIGVDSSGFGATRATVERLSERGSVLWKAAPVQTSSATFTFGVAAADGSVYAFGTQNSSAVDPLDVSAQELSLLGAKFSADGHVLWQHADLPSILVEVYGVTLGADGAAVVAYRQDMHPTLTKSGSSADAFAWSLTPGVMSDCGAKPVLRSAPNGDFLFACAANNASPYSASDLRITAQGSIFQSRVSPYGGHIEVQALSDSSELSALQHYLEPGPNGTQVGSNALDFSHTARDGSTLAAPQAQGAVALGGNVDAGTFGPDGSAYIVTDGYDRKQSEIARVAPDGTVVWRRRLTGAQAHRNDTNYYPLRLTVTPEAVCMVLASGMACYGVADGALRGSDSFGATFPVQYPIAQTLADGSIEVLYYGSSARQLLLSAAGSVISDKPFPYGTFENINASGATIVQPSADATAYSVIARDGTHTYDAHLTAADGAVARAFLADDGTALLLAATNTRSSLMRVDAHGSKLWTHNVDASPSAPFQHYDDAYGFSVRDGYAYLVLSQQFGPDGYGDFPPTHYTYTVEKVALSDGSVAWSAPFDGEPVRYLDRLDFAIDARAPQLRVDAAGQRVLVTTASLPDRVRTQVLDAGSGALVSDRIDGCGGTTCGLLATSLGSDGALRALLDSADAANGHFQSVRLQSPPFDAPAPIRVDQAGIAGAWYAPYASGQGFNIDYFADSNTVFMPWFTYDTSGSNDPAGLQWYALQGAAVPDARRVDFAITAADPGAFASGAVGVHAVGSAQLAFADCSNATLSYRFAGGINGNAAGVISLARLLPSTQACVLADGSSVAAQAPNAAAHGFDARQSGSWYDAASSGQGLEITVLPPSDGSNGLLFAAWFTFDPAGAADEATQHHWFTLQGDLSSAANGAVSLPILRTIGGSLDAQPTANTVQVGTATLTFSACDAAQLDYRFDSSDVAHAFAGLSGTIPLARIGGCSAP